MAIIITASYPFAQPGNLSLTGDVTGTGTSSIPTVAQSVGGSSATNIHAAELLANGATSANTASKIVKRDGSGNFSAGTVTANLSGSASSVTGVGFLSIQDSNTPAFSSRLVSQSTAPLSVDRSLVIDLNNGSRTLQMLAGNVSFANAFTTSGNFAVTFTATNTTSLTLPTAGTLATLAGAEALTNKTITTPVIASLTSGSATTTFSTLSTGTGTPAPFSNWASYTPTFVGLGTVSNVSAFWRREADSVRVRGTCTLGTTTGVATSISLPSGANTIDTTKIPGDQLALLGSLYRSASAAGLPSTGNGGWVITAVTGTSTALVYPSTSINSATPGFPTVLGSSLGSSTDRIMFDFTVPVTQFAF